jgi:hypothetical protein
MSLITKFYERHVPLSEIKTATLSQVFMITQAQATHIRASKEWKSWYEDVHTCCLIGYGNIN